MKRRWFLGQICWRNGWPKQLTPQGRAFGIFHVPMCSLNRPLMCTLVLNDWVKGTQPGQCYFRGILGCWESALQQPRANPNSVNSSPATWLWAVSSSLMRKIPSPFHRISKVPGSGRYRVPTQSGNSLPVPSPFCLCDPLGDTFHRLLQYLTPCLVCMWSKEVLAITFLRIRITSIPPCAPGLQTPASHSPADAQMPSHPHPGKRQIVQALSKHPNPLCLTTWLGYSRCSVNMTECVNEWMNSELAFLECLLFVKQHSDSFPSYLSWLNLPLILQGRYFYAWFTEQKSEVQRWERIRPSSHRW